MRCPGCGGEVPGGSKFCPRCGGQMPTPEPDPWGTISGGRTLMSEEGKPLAPKLSKGDRFADRYRIEREIGSGGMGIVYLAEDEWEKAPVCLKLIRPELVANEVLAARFLREGTLARRIRHRNVVAVFDVSQSGGTYYISMEHLEGKSLRVWSRENRAAGRDVPLDAAIRILRQILAGLAEAHRQKIVHRDLKPENVMLLGNPLSEDCRVKILDFGIARLLDADDSFTVQGSVLGTPVYIAPEQRAGAEGAEASADLYVAGVILYEILVGVPPEGRWDPPSEARRDLPKTLDKVISKALSPHPKRRYASAVVMASALADVLAGSRSQQAVWGYTYTAREPELLAELLRTPLWTPGEPARNEKGMLVAVHAKTRLSFVLAPGGEFDMGSICFAEEPVHRVKVPAFLICATPCTQEAWLRGGGEKKSDSKGASRPVENVSWEECLAWCAENGLRLPSDSEWEYACRAGTKTEYWFGDEESDLLLYGWSEENSGKEAHPVGEFPPNPWGLFDVHGNVLEWCRDWYGPFDEAPSDGSARETQGASPERVARGGCWVDPADLCGSAWRWRFKPTFRESWIGFRPAASLSLREGTGGR